MRNLNVRLYKFCSKACLQPPLGKPMPKKDTILHLNLLECNLEWASEGTSSPRRCNPEETSKKTCGPLCGRLDYAIGSSMVKCVARRLAPLAQGVNPPAAILHMVHVLLIGANAAGLEPMLQQLRGALPSGSLLKLTWHSSFKDLRSDHPTLI
eukprot:5059416-Amphidinium_carterae.1